MPRLASWLLALVLVVLAVPQEARAQSCDRPRVMLVVDKSSSMVRWTPPGAPPDSYECPAPDSQNKWTIARSALQRLLTDYASRIDFGLQRFPDPNTCSPGSVVLPIGRRSATEVMDALGDAPPCSGNYTPSYQTLDRLATHPDITAMQPNTYALFLTDGYQWCSSSDPPSERFKGVASVQRLRELGVRTFVVGFGSKADRLALHRMAIAGGMAKPGCDTATLDPAPGRECFYAADTDVDSLSSVFSTFAMRVTTDEVCDGVDNDCDGSTDEGLSRPCSSSCGGGMERCEAGRWTGCSAPEPATETCDGRDNDCDGVTDEGCGGCRDGETRPCGSTLGMCVPGTQRCVGGSWSECMGGVLPTPGPDGCDGLDSDCDALVDEDADCPRGTWCIDGRCVDPQSPPDGGDTGPPPEPTDCRDGETRPCGVTDIGPCRYGTQQCVGRRWDVCVGNVDPVSDTDPCDAVDNDCDGFIDEDADCPAGQSCVEGRCSDRPAGAEPPTDAGPSRPAGPPEDGGCACRLGSVEANPSSLLGVLGLGLLLWRRRKRRA